MIVLIAVVLAGGVQAQSKPGIDEATQALFDAVLVNDLEAVKASVSADADLEARDRWGMTPIDLAVDRGHFKIAHFLLSVRNFRRDKEPDRETTAEAHQQAAPAPQRTTGSVLGGTIGGTVGGSAPNLVAPPKAASGPAVAAAPTAPAPPVPTEPRGVAAREIAPPGAEPPPELAARPQWPADQPNPFDPDVAAPGSSLEIIGDVARPETKPGIRSVQTAARRPSPAVATPRIATPAGTSESMVRTAPPPEPTPAPASTPVTVAPEPIVRTDTEPETPEAAGKPQEAGSERGFFGRMLGAIGLGGEETTAETPAPEPAADKMGAEEPTVAGAMPTPVAEPEPAPQAPSPPPEVTVESTPILRSPADAEPVAVAEPGAPVPRATVRQTQPRVTIRRTEMVRPEPQPVAEPPAPPSPAQAAAPQPEHMAPAVPELAAAPSEQVAAAAQEEPGLLERMGLLFSGDDTPPVEGEEKPGFFGRLASLVPDIGGDGAEEAPAEADASEDEPAPNTPPVPATETAAGAEDGDEPAKEEQRGWMGRALDFVGLGDTEADIQARKEARAAAAAAPKAPPPTKKPGRQVAHARPVTEPKIDRVQSREPLRGVALTLGETTGLGEAAPPVAGGARRPEGCVTKRHDTLLFCVRPVDWPVEMEPHFRVATIMYQGAKAVVRYADGETARFHAIFPAESFNAVAAYFERRFGPPTDEFRREVRPFASTPLANPALMWQSIVGSAEGERVAVLEVRRYDDVRGGFPDTKHGVVMLYWTNAPPIFPQLSSMDLMMIQWSRTR